MCFTGFIFGEACPSGSLPDFLTESNCDIKETFAEDHHGNQEECCNLARNLKRDLEELDFHEKCNDLYQFKQVCVCNSILVQ